MSEIYDRILAELRIELSALELIIFDALRRNPEGLSRQELIRIVYGENRSATYNNDTADRKIRKTIESLRNKGVPILSSSGKAGYRLDASEEAKEEMIAELMSRRNKLDELIQRIRKYVVIESNAIARCVADNRVIVNFSNYPPEKQREMMDMIIDSFYRWGWEVEDLRYAQGADNG